ncbi:expressed protein [Echinococcus multilocularis]|uniref:Expressed protein n=1 Tax=Echinococcus multilocularis TaxID=6211 RepID=A0A068Y4G7_ECHMU|nr:expressed protein [Echinococcus multilocularis]
MQFQTDYLHLITQHSLFLSPNHVAITHDIVFLSYCYYLRSLIARHAHALFHCFFCTWSCSFTPLNCCVRIYEP